MGTFFPLKMLPGCLGVGKEEAPSYPVNGVGAARVFHPHSSTFAWVDLPQGALLYPPRVGHVGHLPMMRSSALSSSFSFLPPPPFFRDIHVLFYADDLLIYIPLPPAQVILLDKVFDVINVYACNVGLKLNLDKLAFLLKGHWH